MEIEIIEYMNAGIDDYYPCVVDARLPYYD